MLVKCYNTDIEIPDILVAQYVKEFEVLPGKGLNMEINLLRGSIAEVIDLIAEEPDLIDDFEYRTDFIRALAMKRALAEHGILYDA